MSLQEDNLEPTVVSIRSAHPEAVAFCLDVPGVRLQESSFEDHAALVVGGVLLVKDAP